MEQLYITITAILFGLLGLIWRRDDGINLVFKATFIGVALWGCFIAFQLAGYIVKG